MSALSQEDSWLLSTAGGSVQAFYTEIGVRLPNGAGVNVDVSCFSNPTAHRRDDRNASCSVSLISGLWACHGCGQKGNAYQAALAFGYTERRARELAQSHGLFLEVVKPDEPQPRLPDERRLVKWRLDLLASDVLMDRLLELKGWTRPAIVRCGLGWDGERLTFTHRDKRLKRVGVKRYLPGAPRKMVALPGSKPGLFPPPEVMSRREPLFVVEGEPAAVSVRSCGLQAVSIPGTQGWRAQMASRLMPFNVIFLPDCDAPGRDLAERVVRALPRARTVDLEPSCTDGSDVGEWVAEASHEGGVRQIRRLLERVVG